MHKALSGRLPSAAQRLRTTGTEAREKSIDISLVISMMGVNLFELLSLDDGGEAGRGAAAMGNKKKKKKKKQQTEQGAAGCVGLALSSA